MAPPARRAGRTPVTSRRPRRAKRSAGAVRSAHERWLEVAIRVPATAADRLGTLLIEAGSPGVITSVRDLGRGSRPRTNETVRGFFPHAEESRARFAVEAVLRRTADRGIARAHVTWRELDARLWETDWREHFRPVLAGRSLVVVPPWNREPHARRRRVVIHPGMAFGTGQHATTLACLEAIEHLASPPPAAALDVGTGSGVLAIALAKLGVRRVLALDTDPCAIAAARGNLRRNRVGGRVRLSVRPLDAHSRSVYPLVVANLYVDALVTLAPTLRTRVAAGGHLIASGVLCAQQQRLRAAFAPPSWRVRNASRRGPWVTTIFERRPTPRAGMTQRAAIDRRAGIVRRDAARR